MLDKLIAAFQAADSTGTEPTPQRAATKPTIRGNNCRQPGILVDVHQCCHTFRATGITAYLQNGGTIENAQQIAAHSSPRTTKLYDRRQDQIILDEVERIIL